VDPALTPVGTQDQPVHAATLQEQDLVATIDDAYLGRTQFIRAIEQSHQPVTNLPALVILTSLQAAGRKRETRRFHGSPQRIRAASPLQ